MPPAQRRESSRVVYENAWMTVTEDAITQSDGRPGIYGVVHKSDFAIVLPRTADGFFLVEQFRYPVGRREWEFPQGTFPVGVTGTAGEDGGAAVTGGCTTGAGLAIAGSAGAAAMWALTGLGTEW